MPTLIKGVIVKHNGDVLSDEHCHRECESFTRHHLKNNSGGLDIMEFESFNVKTSNGLLFELEEVEHNPLVQSEEDKQYITEVQYLVYADADVQKKPWHNDMFGAMAYVQVPSGKGYAYHGFILDNLFEGELSGRVFCSKPGRPLLIGEIGGILEIAQSRLKSDGERGQVEYHKCYSQKGKVLHGCLIDSMFDHWFIKTMEGHWKFDLVRLKQMERELIDLFPYYVHKDAGCEDLIEKLYRYNVPVGLAWIPSLQKRLNELDSAES
jgi:hypothetical protein